MTALLEKALAQVKQLPDSDQDAVAVRFLQTLAEYEREKQQTASKPRPQFGSAKGLGYMREDFEEPLEEFKEYTG